MNGRQKKGLTYGRLVLIMLALVVLIVGYAYWRQLSRGPVIDFDHVSFSSVQEAAYFETQVDSTTLTRLKSVTPNTLGTLIFVRTNQGNFAKLAVEFAFGLIDPQNIKFKIHQGVVYSAEGQIVQQLSGQEVDLSLRFDLDSGAYEGQGAPEGSADLYFVYRGPGLQLVRALPKSFIALPSTADLND